MRQAIIRAGLESLYFSGLHRIVRGLLGGVGVILTFHHVRPARNHDFQPNRLLEVSPEFLDEVIASLKTANVEMVSLDEMYRRLGEGDFARRFACLTFDDGYRDNLVHAYPVLKRHGVPFAIYVPTSFPEGQGDLWWLTLEEVIARAEEIRIPGMGVSSLRPCRTPAEKKRMYADIYWRLRAFPDERMMRETVNALAAEHGLSPHGRCQELCLTWEELRRLAADPLVTIGAHTVHHLMLAKADDDVVRAEMQAGAATIEQELGCWPSHFSYPVGDATSAGPREFTIARDVGFKTAVTTRPGVLFPDHRNHLTALPRISLNGEFQKRRYVDVLTSGAATALWNGFRRVNAA